MEKIEILLTECIKEIRSGKATLAECLNRYPSRRKELEPLLNIALNIQEPQPLKLDSSYKQNAKARLLLQIRNTKQKKSRSFSDIFSFGLPPQYVWARVAMSVLAAVILLSSIAGGTAYAAQSSLPGDLLYPVKITTEDVRLLVAGSNSAKAELNLEFAQTRLLEMSKLIARNDEDAEKALNGYRGNLDAAKKHIGGISNISNLSDLLNSALEDIQTQVIFCDDLTDANPDYSATISQAGVLAVNEQIELLLILEQQDILRAAQINLDAMRNRLQRAQATASGDHYHTMQEALLQYQKLSQIGEQILSNAQENNNYSIEIEELSLQAISGYLDIIDSIAKQVPQEYQSSVEVCRQLTSQFQNQAGYKHQHQGELSQDLDIQSPGNGSGFASGQEGQTMPQYRGGNENMASQAPNATTASSPGNQGSNGNGDGTGTGIPGGTGYIGGNGSSPATTILTSAVIDGDMGNSTGFAGSTNSDVDNRTISTLTPVPFTNNSDSIGSESAGNSGDETNSGKESGQSQTTDPFTTCSDSLEGCMQTNTGDSASPSNNNGNITAIDPAQSSIGGTGTESVNGTGSGNGSVNIYEDGYNSSNTGKNY